MVSEPLRMQELVRQFRLIAALGTTMFGCGNQHTEPNKAEQLEGQSSERPADDKPLKKPPHMDEVEAPQVDEGPATTPTWEGIRVAVHSPSGEVLGSERRSLLNLIKALGTESQIHVLTAAETTRHVRTTSKLVLVTLNPIRHRDGKRFSGGLDEVALFMDGHKFFTHKVEDMAEGDFIEFGTNALWVETLAQSAKALKAVLQ